MTPDNLLFQFTPHDLINIIIISVVFIFLLVLFKINSLIRKPLIYLKLALMMIITIIVIDVLIDMNVPMIHYLLPVSYFLYFSLYPIIYIYSRDMIFHGEDQKRLPIFILFIFPIIIFAITSLFYYPLSFEEKMEFINYHFSQRIFKNNEFTTFRDIIIPGYYIQTTVYIVLTFSLVKQVRKNLQMNFSDIKIVKFIFIYIIGVLSYEFILISVNFIFPLQISDINLIETGSRLLFVMLGLYVGFNHTLLLIQSHLTTFAIKLEKEETSKPILSDSEKEIVKIKMENYLQDSKCYLDPNLSLESFSKKVHIQSRKISKVINHLFSKNFHQFINDYRITAAIELMNTEKTPNIENIYTKVGFNSRSTFNRVFKEITGKSPSEYITRKKSA